MAVTFRNVGAVAGGTSTNPSPGLPASWAVDDIHILVAVSRDNQAHTVSGWTQWMQVSNGTSERISIWWRRAQTGDAAPTVTRSTNTAVIAAQIAGFYNCYGAGSNQAISPFDSGSSTTNVSTTTGTNTITGITTNKNATMVVATWGHAHATNATEARAYSSGGVATTTTAIGLTGTSTTRAAVQFAYGIKATAGATGNQVFAVTGVTPTSTYRGNSLLVGLRDESIRTGTGTSLTGTGTIGTASGNKAVSGTLASLTGTATLGTITGTAWERDSFGTATNLTGTGAYTTAAGKKAAAGTLASLTGSSSLQAPTGKKAVSGTLLTLAGAASSGTADGSKAASATVDALTGTATLGQATGSSSSAEVRTGTAEDLAGSAELGAAQGSSASVSLGGGYIRARWPTVRKKAKPPQERRVGAAGRLNGQGHCYFAVGQRGFAGTASTMSGAAVLRPAVGGCLSVGAAQAMACTESWSARGFHVQRDEEESLAAIRALLAVRPGNLSPAIDGRRRNLSQP